MAEGIRRRVLHHTINNDGGYLSQACSAAEILASLYGAVLNLASVEKPLIPEKFRGVPGPENKDYKNGSFFHGVKSRNMIDSSSLRRSIHWFFMQLSLKRGAWMNRGWRNSIKTAALLR